MANCVEIDGLGYVKQSSDPIDECAGYVIMHSTEYSDLPTLTDLFTIPVAADLQQMWMLGFSLPVITYLTAWAYGVVINWFNEKH
ncbi:MAG: hypothetical protein M8364_18450 [Methylobacter sp.]|uniref:hypothetical protein n=1 Tax=Methylobacter sp. TaxID=2051955 RepID=UPI002589D5C8|nr:hypothetical protein [Methylobacter sp.]MCL7422875.1 hypothetical protein [Methylobacter sp.]